MDYSIKPLTPELASTFAEYLERLDFGHAPHWATCYCMFYHLACSHEEWQNRKGPENRAEAIERIGSGTMKGYLAFDGDKCIGWCNANDAVSYVRLEKELEPVIKDKRVGSTICYVIHQEYRGKGIARQLLNTAIEDFKRDGYDAMLALPVDVREEPQKHYRGTVNMYKEQGFREIQRHGDVCVMWLEL